MNVDNFFSLFFSKLWNWYKQQAEIAASGTTQSGLKDISYWRQKLFTIFTIYFIPISFIALIPGVWMSVITKLYFVGIFDIVAAASISLIIFNKRLSPNFKKGFVASMLYLLGVFLLGALGLFGPGVIYLFAITVFLSLILPGRWAYWSIVLHLLTCTFFALVSYYQLYHFALDNRHTLGTWVAFSSNLIFLSLVSVIMIGKIINGLEDTIKHEHELQGNLQKEGAEKSLLVQRLLESEGHYKSLFILNPMPMWVLDVETSRFLEVNDAAIRNYSYSKEEFLSMSFKDIKGDNDTENFVDLVNGVIMKNETCRIVTSHHGKNEIPFPVDMRYSSIPFKGQKAILGISRNIARQVGYTNAIEKQSLKLREIAYIQSHVVRAPLARIMGLTNLILETIPEPSMVELLNYLQESANEFDEIVKTIIEHTDQIDIELNSLKTS